MIVLTIYNNTQCRYESLKRMCRVGRSSNSVYTGRFQVVKVKVIKIKAVLYKTCRALWYINISCNNIFSHNKEVYVACWWKSYDPNKLDVCFLIIFPWTSMIHYVTFPNVGKVFFLSTRKLLVTELSWVRGFLVTILSAKWIVQVIILVFGLAFWEALVISDMI